MKFAVIPPLANLNLMNQGKIIFALAQLYLRHQSYREFIQEKKAEGWFIIMDNGAGDFDLISNDELIGVVKELLPSEVIAPDVIFNKDATIEGYHRFMVSLYEHDLYGKVDVHFVPQGNTPEEWMDCYSFALEQDDIKTIGMSKIGIPHAWLGKFKDDQNTMEARHMCYDFLLEQDLIEKPLHFLGAQDPNEFARYTNPLARSTDSCFTALAAMHDIEWAKGDFTRIPTPKNYFTDGVVNYQQIPTFVANVEYLAHICKRKQSNR